MKFSLSPPTPRARLGWVIAGVVTIALAATAGAASAADGHIIVASTTSTQNSGLLDAILPEFRQATGVEARVVAVGTGAALDMGRRCDADVELVHAPAAEKKFVAEGFGLKRHPVMYNDFVIVGPASDPAGIKGMDSAAKALAAIAKSKSPFTSRGDDSGTNKKELSLWSAAAVDPTKASGEWYRETGSGMGATLNTARAMDAYALADRGTWISFNNRGDLKIQVEGDKALFNPYSVMRINPAKCPKVNVAGGEAFVAWITGKAGQKAIAGYRLKGEQLFHPSADED
ncbi:MAG: substrate-binding domain-containing protein [Rhodanobacter sp.]